ncbi:MAG: MurR/RpiR family transcriptional regulator, partial [Pseudomonadota bacterium]
MDPTLKTQTLERLKGKMPDLAPRLRLAAKYIIDHPADFGLDAIRTTGRKAGVSTYTLVRLAEAFGFESYEAFRAPFRQALVAMAPATARPDWLAEMGRRSFATPQARAVENTLGTVNRSLYQQDPAQIVRLADAMLGARMVYLTASRASYALAYFLHYVGRMALPSLHLIPRHMNSPIDELSVARPGDMILAITFTPYSRDTVEACRFAQSRGVRLVLLTDS